MAHFVWVYWAGGAKADEIRWSVRSVLNNVEGEHDVTIVGDKPDWYTGHMIKVPKTKLFGPFTSFRDVLRKLMIAGRCKEIADEFFWMMDDVYVIKPVTVANLSKRRYDKHVSEATILHRSAPRGKWHKIKFMTMKKLYSEGLPTYDYATHLPHLVNGDKLVEIIEKYGLMEGKDMYLWENLYGNTYYKDPVHFRVDDFFARYAAKPKAGQLDIDPRTVINNTDPAWSVDFRKFFLSKFPDRTHVENGDPMPPNPGCRRQTNRAARGRARAAKTLQAEKKLPPTHKFIRYLEGKRVAIVGNAAQPELMGEEIDSYDVVIRFNKYQIKGFEKQVGTKTHVWAHCQNDGVPLRNEEYDFIVCPNPKERIGAPRLAEVKHKTIPTLFGEMATYNLLKIGRPSTGLAMANWLWHEGIRFQCFGFDHFKSAHYFDNQKTTYHNVDNEEDAFAKYMDRREVVAVIPYFKKDPTRQGPFEFVRRWARSKFDQVFVEEAGEGVFNKPKLINAGLRKVPRDSLVAIIDADVIVNDESLRKAIALSRVRNGIVYPFLKIKNICKADTEMLVKRGSMTQDELKLHITGAPVQRAPGAFVMVPATTAIAVGGFDERFTDWGGEDNAFKWMTEKLVQNATRVDGTLLHFNHQTNRLRPRHNLTIWRDVRKSNIQKLKRLAIANLKKLDVPEEVAQVVRRKPTQPKKPAPNAPASRAQELVKRIADIPSPVVCEVGVLRGDMTKQILAQHKTAHVYMVDSWLTGPEQPARYKDTGDTNAQSTKREALAKENAAKLVAVRNPARTTIVKGESVAVTTDQLLGTQFDLVFIDADHSFEGTFSDIFAYLPLVKVGGWIGGHDYDNKENDAYDFSGVKKAVDHLAWILRAEVELGDNFTWWIKTKDQR